jgi:hypothetical protein
VFVRIGWKSLSGTNALAYYENSLITAVKSFTTLAPGVLPSFIQILGNKCLQEETL